MYGNTISREADLPCKDWRPLPAEPAEPAEQSGLSIEDYDNCSIESNYDSISLPCERKTPAKPLDPDIKAVTGPSIFFPTQWKKYWKRNRVGVLLILTSICLLLSFLILFSNNSREEKRKVSQQKMEEQLLRIERKLGRLQNCRASPEAQSQKYKQGWDSLASIPPQVQSPDISWQRFQTNVYYFSDTEENWEMARKKCADHDSRLLIINTKQEQDFVIQTLKQSIWLGLSDTETEGTWRWVDGSLLKKGSWRTGEPNNGGKNGEDCAVLYKEGKWNDIHCNERVKFVCEKEEVSVQ